MFPAFRRRNIRFIMSARSSTHARDTGVCREDRLLKSRRSLVWSLFFLLSSLIQSIVDEDADKDADKELIRDATGNGHRMSATT
jgi:hypothetical protein